jgi:multisubunit Na+/H+ antiporter MnhB subunit
MIAVFDWLLVLVIVGAAWRALSDRDLFRALIKFIALGLLIAVAWVRLRAPDVALAEAAVGSGLTGALMLSALVRMRRGAARSGLSRKDRHPGAIAGAAEAGTRGPEVSGREFSEGESARSEPLNRLDCGGKRSATPLLDRAQGGNSKVPQLFKSAIAALLGRRTPPEPGGKVGPRCARPGAGAPAPYQVQGFNAQSRVSENSPQGPGTAGGRGLLRRMGLGLLTLSLFAALVWALFSLPAPLGGLTERSLERLSDSGVENPVTAVLLNYRGYDTLLEVGVLLLAIVGVWSVRRGDRFDHDPPPHPLLLSLLRLLLPVLLLAAGYLLWIGAFAPGGAFQGGALLGGALVLMLLGGLGRRFLRGDRWLRIGLAFGLLVFAGVCAVTQLFTGGFLEYPSGHAGTWILVIESAALVSIGLTLGALYLGGRPAGVAEEGEESRSSKSHD